MSIGTQPDDAPTLVAGAPAPTASPRLLARLREAVCVRHYFRRTEEA